MGYEKGHSLGSLSQELLALKRDWNDIENNPKYILKTNDREK